MKRITGLFLSIILMFTLIPYPQAMAATPAAAAPASSGGGGASFSGGGDAIGGGPAVVWQSGPWETQVVYSQGDYGNDIRLLQEILKDRGYFDGEPDGIFGDTTRRSLRTFQADNGFQADGILRHNTWCFLKPEDSGMDHFIEEYEEDDLILEFSDDPDANEAESAEEPEESEEAEETEEERKEKEKKKAKRFLFRSIADNAVAYGVVDFRGSFGGVQDDFILVPIHVRDLEVGQQVKAVLSNGSEFELTCMKEETVLVPFPKDASNIGYVIYLL